MSSTVALTADTLSNGTYSLEDIERVINESSKNKGMTLDVTTGNILFCGKRAGWSTTAKRERMRGDLAMLNVLRHSADVLENPYAKALLNDVTRDVTHKNRPLTTRRIYTLVQELRSMREASERGKDLLLLHKARLLLEHGGLLDEIQRDMNHPALNVALELPANRTLLSDVARSILSVLREMFCQNAPEHMFNMLFFIMNAERKLHAALPDAMSDTQREVAPTASRSIHRWRQGGAEDTRSLGSISAFQPDQTLTLATETGMHLVLTALRRAGMDASFVTSVQEGMAAPGMQGFFAELRALSRPGYCRDMHPVVAEKTSAMLDALMQIWRSLPGECVRPDLFSVHINEKEEPHESKLRELATEFFDVPSIYQQAEATQAIRALVEASLTPTTPFDFTRTGTEPYQLEKVFICDMPREARYVNAWVPAQEGRTRLDFSTLEEALRVRTIDERLFSERMARQICGDDRKAVYALSCVLNQGLCNGVLMALYTSDSREALGFNLLPRAFGPYSFKNLEVERLPSGDLLVSTVWRPVVLLAGARDHDSGFWKDEAVCEIRRSRFAIDICVRLLGDDIAQGLCRPHIEKLNLEMGIVIRPQTV